MLLLLIEFPGRNKKAEEKTPTFPSLPNKLKTKILDLGLAAPEL